MTRNFEQAVVGGQAHGITSYEYEPAASKLVIRLTHTPGAPTPTRAIEFRGIQQIETEWIDRDDAVREGLLGAHENDVAGLVQYRLVTEQREITLTTRQKALIHHGPNSPVPSIRE